MLGYELLRSAELYGAYAKPQPGGVGAGPMAGAGKEPGSPRSEAACPAPTQRERHRQWARLIAKMVEVDPLRCVCGGATRVISFILDPAVIRKILQHLPGQRASTGSRFSSPWP